jgi:hypothetical protein
MEEVVDDRGLRAVLPHFQLVGGVHVHDDGPQALTALGAELLKEGADVLASTATPHPEDSTAAGVHHHRRIALAFEQGELVHRDDLHTRVVGRAEASLQKGFVDGFDGVPAQIEEVGYVPDG